jgi:hypothetical protein
MRTTTAARGGGTSRVNGSSVIGPPSVRSPLPTRQRRTGYTAVGLLLVIGLAAAFAYLYSTAGEKVPVVVVTGTLAAGEVIERSDLCPRWTSPGTLPRSPG